jgi:hypothetical protein
LGYAQKSSGRSPKIFVADRKATGLPHIRRQSRVNY